MADGIISTDLHGKIKTVNPAALAIWKMSESQFAECSFLQRLQCERKTRKSKNNQHFLGRLRALTPGQIAPLHIETQITDHYGDKLDIEVSLSATERKDHVELIVVVRDISARKRLETMQVNLFLSSVTSLNALTSIIGSLRLIEGGVFGKLPTRQDGAHCRLKWTAPRADH